METTTTTTMIMSCQDSGSALCHCSTDLGGGGSGGEEDFLGLSGDRRSSDDLFELVWRGAAGGGSGGCSMEGQTSCNSPVAVVPVPERPLAVEPPPAPPSEAEMAAWLFPIVCGEEFAGGGDAVVVGGRRGVDDDQMVPAPLGKDPSSDHKLQEKRKTSSTGGRRSHHHHAGAHSMTEKRRRWKINERLKTLQQLVPGCDNSNQASTLDQTIRYMKSLQQHIQAMSSFKSRMKPTSLVAVYPVAQQAPCLACGQGGTSVQQGWLLGGSQL